MGKRENLEVDPRLLTPYANNARTYTRLRTCIRCGETGLVRKDSTAKQCRPCAASVAGKKGNEARRAKSMKIDCCHCGKTVSTIRSAPRKFCSLACRRAGTNVQRECEVCKKDFKIAKSLVSGYSNSSGRFCSRPCYIHHMCRTGRVTGRGSQWKQHRNESLRRNRFCALCGTGQKLQVHHALPFRLTHDNSQKNLFPLCVKHHKIVESQFVETEATGIDNETLAFVWQNILSEYQQITRSYLKELT